jgi:hypothetical protein
MKVTTEERGWAGHFCLADRCNFRRNTLVSYGDKRIVVSTVGFCVLDPNKSTKAEEIGVDRFYETMMFVARLDMEIYWDADVSRQINAPSGVPWSLGEQERDSDKKANEMHEQNVQWVVENIKALEGVRV